MGPIPGRYDLVPVLSGATPEEPWSPDQAPGSESPSASAGVPPAAGTSTGGGERVAPLRGAGVTVTARRAGLGLLAAVLVGVAVLAVVLFVAGARKNAQIDELHHHGVPVEMTVTTCIGLLGGSGSNGAGYACHGTFALGGTTYDDPIPGSAILAPGSKIAGVTVASDPALFTTAALLPTQHTSASVYVAPVVLTVVLVVALAAIAVLWRRHRLRAPGGGPADPA
jgi:hypothetical protein